MFLKTEKVIECYNYAIMSINITLMVLHILDHLVNIFKSLY